MQNNHITMKVGATTSPFIIRPPSWSEVDVVDWSPRAVSGTPSRSELGLYLDVGQEGFGHGYGKERFVEPESYQWTGHLVDTSHGFASLFTLPVSALTLTSGTPVIKQGRLHRMVELIGYSSGLYVIRAGGTPVSVITSLDVRDIMSNGTYFFLAVPGTMQIGDLGDVASATATSITAAIAPGWFTNIFATGAVYIYAGTGSGQIQAVASNSPDTINVASWSVRPDSTSKFLVIADAGSVTYPPQNFYRLAMYGGFMWGSEYNVPWVHKWSQLHASDAQGQQGSDSTASHVGPGNFYVNNLVPFQNQLWVCREDGVWAIGDDDIPYHILDFADQAHADNFKAAVVWNGFLYFTVRNVLYRYKSGLQDVTPPLFDQHWPVKGFGDYSALVPRGKFLYLLARANNVQTLETNETQSFGVIMRTDDGATWHKIVDIYNNTSGILGNLNAFLDPVQDRFYYSWNDNDSPTFTSHLYYFRLQPLSDLPYASFPTSEAHDLYTSFFDEGLMRVDKSHAEITVDAEFPTGTSAIAYYRVDDETAFTSIGTFNATTKSLALPTPGVVGKRIQVKLNFQTSSSGNTAIVRAVLLKLMIRPTVKYGVNFEVLVESDQSTPGHGKLGFTAKQIRANLKAARASVNPIEFTDIHGEVANAYVSSLRFYVVQYENEQGQLAYTEEVARCTVVYV